MIPPNLMFGVMQQQPRSTLNTNPSSATITTAAPPANYPGSDSASGSASVPAGDADRQGIKRKRLTQACDACRKKKVKCSGEKPICQNCHRLGIECTYMPTTKKRGPRVGLVESLERRLQQMERLLGPLREQGIVNEDFDDRPLGPSPKKQRLSGSGSSSSSSGSSGSGNGSSNGRGSSSSNGNTNDNSNGNGNGSGNGSGGSNANGGGGSGGSRNNAGNGNSSGNDNGRSGSDGGSMGVTRASQSFANDRQAASFAQIPVSRNTTNNTADTYAHAFFPSPVTPDISPMLLPTHQPSVVLAEPPVPPPTVTKPQVRAPIQQTTEISDEINCVEAGGEEGEEFLYFGTTSIIPGMRKGICGMPAAESDASPRIHNIFAGQALIKSNRALPPPDIVEHLAQLFFKYVAQAGPIQHEATFMKRLRLNKVAPILVWSMCAAASRFSHHPSIACNPPYKAGEPFAEIASTMLMKAIDEPSLENVQALTLLGLHSYGACKGPRAWMFIGMASRMAVELGLHKEITSMEYMPPKERTPEEAFIERETRRRTFWMCFIIDRVAASALGRPMVLHEADIDLRMPCDDLNWMRENPEIVDMENGVLKDLPEKKDRKITLDTSSAFSCHISVAAMLGRVAEYVNRSSPKSIVRPWDSNSEFKTLVKEVHACYQNLPPELRWSRDVLTKHVDARLGAAYVTIHVLYYCTVVVLHRPNVAALQNNAYVESQRDFYVKSADLCTAAAKEVSTIANVLVEMGFYFACPFTLYPMFATGTIHINDSFSPDKLVAETAKKCLQINERFLVEMQPFWATAGKLVMMLKEMRRVQLLLSTFDGSGYNGRTSGCPTLLLQNRTTTNNTEHKFQPTNSVLASTDFGLMEFWNKASFGDSGKGTAGLDSVLQEIAGLSEGQLSMLMPDVLSPRTLMGGGSTFDFTTVEPWTSLLRTPGLLTPRSAMRLAAKRDEVHNREAGGGASTGDYFAQDAALYGSVNTAQLAYGAGFADATTTIPVGAPDWNGLLLRTNGAPQPNGMIEDASTPNTSSGSSTTSAGASPLIEPQTTST